MRGASYRPVCHQDEQYWSRPPGNRVSAISAKFTTAKVMASYLRLDSPVGTFASRSWVLGDILVSLDLNANGHVASWRVSGPAPLIEGYLSGIEQMHSERHEIYDLSSQDICMEPSRD
jgi:hypothetical protein